ncbi:nuclear transport factor 2 family protein [Brachybacterium sp. YJGR34]|uniref:nuclear transport factor 2 family protein n=1 Tax=Brachybacterium sp. YJGR34 TaxID=2059911 RepID=UPI000E0BD0B9|nr:nuclear transport factor 2 family protein [Brachybacterium sp. YJGR34]
MDTAALTSRENLVRREHEGWEALCRGEGGTFYGELMTEDAVMVLVNGMVLDRDAVVASLDGAPAWDAFTLQDPRRIDLGPGAAALVYTAEARRGEELFTALMTSAYREIDGRLRLALYQQTTITH